MTLYGTISSNVFRYSDRYIADILGLADMRHVEPEPCFVYTDTTLVSVISKKRYIGFQNMTPKRHAAHRERCIKEYEKR